MNLRTLATLAVLSAAIASQAQVIVPSGQPVTILTNPSTYGYTANAFQETDGNVRAWNEQSNYTLTSDLQVDITSVGDYTKDKQLDASSFISKGTAVSSEYLYFDPKKDGSIDATVDFGTNILGIIVTSDSKDGDHLLESDYLIPTGVSSSRIPSSHFANRGLELGSDEIDMLSSTSIELKLNASSPGDQIRVITAAQAVPEPSAFAALAIGALGLILRKRS